MQEVKKTHTKKVGLVTMPKFITREFVDFIVDNIAKYPGASELYLQLIDRDKDMAVKLHTFNKHIEMNDELAHYLTQQRDIDIYIETINK